MAAPSVPTAWEPVTPRGIAAFAQARLGRLLLVQFLTALLLGGTVAWLLHHGFFPTVTSAIEQLPEQGEIRDGTLQWTNRSPQILAGGNFLSLAVDREHSGTVRSLADFQIEFGQTNVLVHSLLGYVATAYPQGWIIAFSRPELSPRWGAWRPVVLALAVAGMVGYLFASWWVLATIYCGPLWLVGLFTNHELTLRASWKLAGAGLMPGALVMWLAIVGYGLGQLNLVRLGFALALHLVVGWVFLAGSLFYVPRLGEANLPANPFTTKKK